MMNVCNISQIVNVPTKGSCNISRTLTFTCIDHIHTNVIYLCLKAITVPVGLSDRNVIATVRKVTVPNQDLKFYFRGHTNFSIKKRSSRT